MCVDRQAAHDEKRQRVVQRGCGGAVVQAPVVPRRGGKVCAQQEPLPAHDPAIMIPYLASVTAGPAVGAVGEERATQQQRQQQTQFAVFAVFGDVSTSRLPRLAQPYLLVIQHTARL